MAERLRGNSRKITARPWLWNKALPYTAGIVPCEERERLTTAYLDAVLRNTEADRAFAETNSEAWRKATRVTQQECEVALADLNAHQKEHGCYGSGRS